MAGTHQEPAVAVPGPRLHHVPKALQRGTDHPALPVTSSWLCFIQHHPNRGVGPSDLQGFRNTKSMRRNQLSIFFLFFFFFSLKSAGTLKEFPSGWGPGFACTQQPSLWEWTGRLDL